MKALSKSIVFVVILMPIFIWAKNQKEVQTPIKFEHLRINVACNEATAKCYVENVGLEIIPSNTKDVIYVADKDHNSIIEFSSIPKLKSTYFDFHIDGFHLAFEGHKTIEAVADKMLAKKGVQEGTHYRSLIGDYVIYVRDPNGFTTQLINRVNPFHPKPLKNIIRFEHFAFNMPEQKTTALWMVESMGLTIPMPKDIDTTNSNYRNYLPYVGNAAKAYQLIFSERQALKSIC